MTCTMESSASCLTMGNTWHKRFGHQKMECIKRMSSNQVVTKVRVSDGKFKYCETCKVVKSKHVPTPRKEDLKPRDNVMPG